MGKGRLYPRLAWTNLMKNRQFYLPYLLTVICTSGAFYIVEALAGASDLPTMTRYAYLSAFMSIGAVVIALFSVIFLSYTNGFLMKRRKKELGLYNVLGLGKRHIALVLFYETLYTALLGIPGGIAVGLLLQKLAAMLLLRIAHADGYYRFYVSWRGVTATLVLFGLILLGNLLWNVFRIRLQNPMELLREGHAGEREPKSHWLLAVLGVLCLGGGYGIAVTCKNALSALALYFVAVFLVIIGTYCLFSAISIVVLKALRRNRSYYYQTNHFIGVSGMLYRMRRNAVGLANICILSTMVLVMVSGTLALYLGSADVLKKQFPGNVGVSVRYDPMNETPFSGQAASQAVEKALAGMQLSAKSVYSYSTMQIYGIPNRDGSYAVQPDSSGSTEALFFLTKAEYAACPNAEAAEPAPLTLRLPDGTTTAVQAARISRGLPSIGAAFLSTIEPHWYVLEDEAAMQNLHESLRGVFGDAVKSWDWYAFWTVQGDADTQLALPVDLETALGEGSLNGVGSWERMEVQGLEEFSREYYSINGGFFFLGLFLGLLFILAAVLIVYYKQVSEGYEDRERYLIMQKVGMERAMVRRSVDSQLLVVFFAPLLAAAVHVAFDFSLMLRLLTLFTLRNSALTLWCTLGTFAVFCAVYALVYRATARTYCRIVEA